MTLLFDEAMRPLRFALTGGLAALVQLGTLALLTKHGWSGIPANLTAFLIAAQVNFALSVCFTWRDRGGSIVRRWLIFHGSISGMALLNMLVFVVLRLVWPDLVASAAGIAVAAVGNFFLGDRLVFRSRGTTADEDQCAAQESAA